MTFFSSFFQSPQIKTSRLAADAARLLRETTQREMQVELTVLASFFSNAVEIHRKVYAAENTVLAERYVQSMAAPRELLERIERTWSELQSELGSKRKSAASVVDWEKLTSLELEIRDGMSVTGEQAKVMAGALLRLNAEAMEHLELIYGSRRSEEAPSLKNKAVIKLRSYFASENEYTKFHRIHTIDVRQWTKENVPESYPGANPPGTACIVVYRDGTSDAHSYDGKPASIFHYENECSNVGEDATEYVLSFVEPPSKRVVTHFYDGRVVVAE